MNVEKGFMWSQTSLIIRESTQGRSPTNVRDAGSPFCMKSTLTVHQQTPQGRSLMNIIWEILLQEVNSKYEVIHTQEISWMAADVENIPV